MAVLFLNDNSAEPVSAPPEMPRLFVPSAVTTPSAARVLVVDDEELIVLALRETLTKEGYSVATAVSAEQALDLVSQEEFALILTDQKMPGLTGLQLLSEAKKIQPHATRVLITGVLDLDTVIASINKGEIYRFIVKPWLREELLATAANAVQRHDLICRNLALQHATQVMNQKLNELNRTLEIQVAREAEQNTQLGQLNRALEQNLNRSVELCVNTLQNFCPGLGGQARRVVELCRTMADSLDLPPEKRQILEMSAWLHDIGLVSVPRRLIKLWQNNPKVLNATELAQIKQHPALGQELAGFVHHLSEVGTVIRAHHERFDGSGYPDGLAGDAIPWLGRILAVAVAYAECAPRDWEPQAIETIQKGSGSVFDPEALRVLVRCRPRSSMPYKEREILLSELKSGMILAKGIYAANGLLLIPEGQILNDPAIDKLRNHNRVNPIHQSLLVYC